MTQISAADVGAPAMRRVMIVGSPGAGKSTFARALRAKTGLPLYYLDMLWHRADHTTVPDEEFDSALADIVMEPAWIIDGNYLRTFWMRAVRADTVVWFDLPMEVCLEGIRQRVGTVREDIPWEPETQLDPDFEQYVIDFPELKRPLLSNMLGMLQKESSICVHIFSSRAEAAHFLNTIC